MKFKKEVISFAIASTMLCTMALLKVYNLHASFYDLALFDWNIWSIAHLGEWQRAFHGHVQPLMLLWALIYKIHGNAYVLVALQSIIISLPLLFLNKLVEKQTDIKELGWLALFAYILYFPIWYNALFDFHLDHMVIPLGILFYIAYQHRKWGWCIVLALLISMVKEPYALMTIGFGIYILLKTIVQYHKTKYNFKEWMASQKDAIIAGAFITVCGFVYLNTALRVISPYFTQGTWIGFESNAYSWMGNSFHQIFSFIISHPIEIILEIIGTPRKVFYIFCILGALAFLPILGPLELIPAIPILAISLLSKVDNYYGIGHHYTAGLISAFMAAFLTGAAKYYAIIKRLKIPKKLSTAFIVCVILIFHVLISTSPISRLFWNKKIWKYGVGAYIPDDRNKIIKNALLEFIPNDNEINISMQNTISTAYLSHRLSPLVFPAGVFENKNIPVFAKDKKINSIFSEYIVIDLKRPWYLIDKGCDWQYGECRDKKKAREFIGLIEILKKRSETLFDYDGFLIIHQSSVNK